MKRVPIFPCIVGLHAALAAAALLWALQARFGDPLTAALSPAWNSPWEQGKAAFFPLLAAGPGAVLVAEKAAAECVTAAIAEVKADE